MPNALKRFVGWLLHLANARAGGVYSREFYALKDRILARWGTRDGEDVQRIVRECWGYAEDNHCAGKTCPKCGGTGVWDERTILLDRWVLGGHVFHRPNRTVYGSGWVPNIHGRIRHGGVSHRASAEAELWLSLLFDTRRFWLMLRRSRNCGWQWRPMLALQAVVFDVHAFLRSFYLRRCDHGCGRWVFRYSPRSFLCQIRCRHCEAESRAAFQLLLDGPDEDLPF